MVEMVKVERLARELTLVFYPGLAEHLANGNKTDAFLRGEMDDRTNWPKEEVLALLSTRPTPDWEKVGPGLVEAVNQALRCTPQIINGEIAYDCGDPWSILRTALSAIEGASHG